MSPQRILHKKQMTQGYTCISKALTKINIYMKLDILKWKYVQNREYKLKCKNHQN